MSLLGFDALGRKALGELPHAQQSVVLTADVGSLVLAGNAAGFSIVEAASAGSVALSGVTATFRVAWPEAGAVFASVGAAASFAVSEAAVTGSVALGGVPVATSQTWRAAGASVAVTFEPALLVPAVIASPGALQATAIAANDTVLEAAAGAVVVLSPSPTDLVRTGDDHEFKLGGVGHFRLELERAKQLARITRKVPPPVDLRTASKFKSIRVPQSVLPATGTDLSAGQFQHLASQMRVVAAAKKRCELEAILLLGGQ
ncbi:hypothetical protein [Bradyrhizobium sp. SZCCHNS2015]|uniref:hypothetical protein n=1 Tax=Bradyrhizobium sp. SZCCHNS2015 TaxID=3057305 RepID=UPI0028E63A24|nr:hypothetical protein [Bradyrhizobium sp. SZCCHNS2015]